MTNKQESTTGEVECRFHNFLEVGGNCTECGASSVTMSKDTYNGTDTTTHNASPDYNKDTLKEKLRDKFMDFWDSKKNILGIGDYSDAITYFWLDEIDALIEQERQAERERVVKIINDATNYDHSKCPIKQTCVGYQSCVSDIMNALSQNTTQEDVTNETNV